MSETKVVHCKKEAYDVYIGRPHKWGNPFVMGPACTREQAIERFENHLRNSPKLLEALPELVGKRLGCWCSPKPCHGDVIIKVMKERGLI